MAKARKFGPPKPPPKMGAPSKKPPLNPGSLKAGFKGAMSSKMPPPPKY